MLPPTAQAHLTLVLLAWALVTLSASVVALGQGPREWWRAFWWMSGLWGAVDGGIAYLGLVRDPVPPEELGRLLLLNAALDVGYLAAGTVLYTRTRPLLRGFGVAILMHGLFLLVLDLYFWKQLVPG